MPRPKPKPKAGKLASIRVSGAFRFVTRRGKYRLEVFNNKEEARSAGVSEKIADAVFSDIRPAYCYAEIDTLTKKIVYCKKRSLGEETCQGKCQLYGNGVLIEEDEHQVVDGVVYRCRCSV